jgi:octaprenyl-diphosphate synthase
VTALEARPAGSWLSDIQRSVRQKLADVSIEMERIVSSELPLVGAVSSHLLAMRGKLFRPTVLLLSSETAESAAPSAVPLAACLELIHLATLVHDDAVDHSALRRGMPTVNSLFSHQISVIMGDFLYSTALARLVELGSLEALRALTRASTDMTLGEMLQLGVTDPLEFGEEEYYALIRAKTASLMRAASELGAIAAASPQRDALESFGENLGMAFQITDDLIDYTEAKETTGKPSGLDLRERKVTLPLIFTLAKASPSSRREIEKVFATATPADADVTRVIEIVSESGGLDYARSCGQRYADQAADALSTLPNSVARTALQASITYVMDRHS